MIDSKQESDKLDERQEDEHVTVMKIKKFETVADKFFTGSLLQATNKSEGSNHQRRASAIVHQRVSTQKDFRSGLDMDTMISPKEIDAHLVDTKENTKPKVKFKKSSSFSSVVDYFGDEVNDQENLYLMQNQYYYRESEVNFSVKQYLEVFLYHMIFFVILGPFINVFGLFSQKLRTFFHNMGFGCNPATTVVMQSWYWLTTISIVVGFAISKLSDDMWPAIDSTLVKAALTASIIRTTSIAGKYATFPKRLFQKYSNIVLLPSERQQEFMLAAWKSQSSEIKILELLHSSERLELDTSLFFIAFFARVNKDSIAHFEKIQQEREDQDTCCFEVTNGNNKGKYMKGEYVLQSIIDAYNEKLRENKHWVIGFLLGILWGFSHLYLRVFFGEPFHGNSILEVSLQYNTVIEASMLVGVQYFFYRLAIVDVNRKLFIMTQMSLMMSPKSMNREATKLFPTINLIDGTSLISWLNMRRLGLDYGKKYFFRHEIFLPVTLILMLLMLLGYFILLYMVQKGGFKSSAFIGIQRLQASMMIDAALYLASSFHFIYCAGSLNDEFKGHTALIERNRLFIRELQVFKEIYFAEFLESTYENRPCAANRPRSYLHVKLAKEITATLDTENEDSDREKALDLRLTAIIESYSLLLEGVAYDAEYAFVTLLGFKVTRASALNGLFAVASFTFAAFQLITNGQN